MMLIAVFGLPGTGKSFFAEKLATTLHASYLNTDIVREHMQKKGSYSARDKQAIYDTLTQMAREALYDSRHVVVDGTFSRKQYRNALVQLAKEENVALCWIKTEADEATVRERVSRNRAHSEADYEVYQKVREEFDAVDFPYLELDSGQMTVEEMIHQAELYIFSAYDRNGNKKVN